MAMIIKNLTKKFGDFTVYENFNLEIEEGKITAILGESGSGKTTLIKCIAGLIDDFQGQITGDYKPVSYVFQKDALVPNLTVEQNLKIVNGKLTDKEIDDALLKVNILTKKKEYPKNLSGGQARRVAILRAFLFPSKTLLMDEPFINLDIALKYNMIDLIKREQRKTGKTVIMISHDISEALLMADRILVLSKGKIICDEKEINKETARKIVGLLKNIYKDDEVSTKNQNGKEII